MKLLLSKLIVSTTIVVASSANAQTLGAAGNYNLFIQNGGEMELKDANQLFGQVAVSNNAVLDGKKESNIFDGTIFKHTGGTIKDGGGLNPSGGIQTSATIDAFLDQANVDLNNYITYLQGLTSTASFGKQTSDFSFTSTMGTTVLDFTEVDLDKKTFTLTGSSSDLFIIRTSKALEFKESDLILNGVSAENVVWYHSGTSNFDLHKSDSDPANFMKFAGTVIAPDALVRIGEVEFTGRVFGSDLKLGSGFILIPEPSSSLMVLIGAGGLLLRRSRK